MGQLFGTDGVRGVAGRDLTAGLAMGLAAAAAEVLSGTGAFTSASAAHRRPFAVVGRDPRASGEFLEAAVVAGLAASGVDVIRLGVMPTPAVAYLTTAMEAEFGVMLSASHNPAPDNGIKFFARGGVKLPDAAEDEIERVLAAQRDSGWHGPVDVPEAGFGRVSDATDQGERYIAHLLQTLPDNQPGQPLAGLRVVVDCAHGAAAHYAPALLRQAGAEVIAIGTEPDGLNINDGVGSTSLGTLTAAVVEFGADAGIAHDGDADRCLAIDSTGKVIDGDQILAILAIALKAEGKLAGDTVVGTVMANLGFRHAMREAGIDVVETPVGDRYLIAAMLDGKFVLGGEQSGHIIMLDHATTGDGLLTALHVLAEAVRQDRPLADLAAVMTRYPQVLITVPGVDKVRVTASPALSDAVAAAEAELGDSGRVLVRPSGTEPAVRVMVEAADSSQAERLAGRLADAIRGLN
ncbi:MAG TPA: phosphoglucosamine mutase [Streptosporangiaceae bacterium]|nr:phosphoglucosamine mutase [Streptosporangiaceae bacterium]